MDRPTAGNVEERTAAVEVADKRIRGRIPYGVESRDLGGWSEVIEPSAFRDTNLDELRAVIDHAGVPLGRYPATLDVEDRSDGLHWALDPPRSREDVVEAIQRGDMRAGSWRMVVARDRWVGDVRHVEAIAELRDVTLCAAQDPAYGEAAHVEYRTSTGGKRRQKGVIVDPKDTGANTVENENENEETTESATEATTEQRSGETSSAGSLNVEQRSSSPRRGLADEFRAAGWPGEAAEIPWQAFEQRSVAWQQPIAALDQASRVGGPLPVDRRYAWSVLERVPVDSGTTSIEVFVHLGSEAASGVVRPIAGSGSKAEVTSTIDLQQVALSGVAAVESNLPNVLLESEAIGRVIEQDLTTAVFANLDQLVIDSFAGSGFESPGSDPLPTTLRKAVTTLQSGGFAPDVAILTPADAEALDTLVSGATGADADYVFSPGQFAPDQIFGLRRVTSAAATQSIVLDSRSYGRVFVSPTRLTTHEQDGGLTNLSRVRLECHAAPGVERPSAAVRLAAS